MGTQTFFGGGNTRTQEMRTVKNAVEKAFCEELYAYFMDENRCDLSEEEFGIIDSMGEYPLFCLFQGFLRTGKEFVNTAYETEYYIKALIFEWIETLAAVKNNDIKTVKAFVRRRIEDEYALYQKKELRKFAIDIFENSDQIHFFTAMKDYLCECEDKNKLEDVYYRILCNEEKIIDRLYENYDVKTTNFNSWTSLHEVVANYCKKKLCGNA